jgi:hypothetical protein
MLNIKFNYLYRDGGNYKNYGFVVFTDPDNIDLEILHQLILSKLIDGTWFYTDQWHLPDLHFDNWNNEIDHTFHEFESLEYSNEQVNAEISLKEFIGCVKATKNNF